MSTLQAGSVTRPGFLSVLRHELVAVCVILGFTNGIAETVQNLIASEGLKAALVESLGLSVIVWIALCVGINLILQGRREAATLFDLVVAGISIACLLAPSSKLSWLVLAAFSAIEWFRSRPKTAERAGALIILALTVPVFWGKVLFSAFSEPLLEMDASIVGGLVGMPHVGNAIKMPGQAGELWIAAGCSSFANVSLTFLWWAVLAPFSRAKGIFRPLATCLLACVCVSALNLARISLMALQPEHYEVLHGPIGAALANWLTTGVIIVLGIVGMRVDLFSRR